MSFILDALKKSESERQRQSGPGVFQPRIASPRVRFPLWALAIGALLAVNLLVLGWLMTRPDDAPSPPAAASPAAMAPAAAAAGSTATQAPAAPPVAVPPGSAPAGAATPVATGPAVGAATPYNPPLIVDPALTAPAPAPAPAGMPGGAAINPNDYVPAQPPAAPTPGTTTPVGGGLGGTTTSFATRESLLARGQQVPEASLSLHVYDAQPARRFVFINGQRGIEGDTLPSGLRIEQIVPEGVVLSWSGNRFLVPLQ